MKFRGLQTVSLPCLKTLFYDFEVTFMSLDVVNCLVNVFLMSKIATVCESKDFEILLIFIIDITTQISDFSINDNSLMLNLI